MARKKNIPIQKDTQQAQKQQNKLLAVNPPASPVCYASSPELRPEFLPAGADKKARFRNRRQMRENPLE